MSVNYLAPAIAQDVAAVARVVRRGRWLVNDHVEARRHDGQSVADVIVTYQVG